MTLNLYGREAVIKSGGQAGNKYLSCDRAVRALSGRDQAILSYAITGSNPDPTQASQLKAAFTGNVIEVFVQRPAGLERVHWGRVSAVRPALSGDGPQFQFLSRVEHYDFGDRLLGPLTRTRRADGTVGTFTVDGEVIFNPTVDGTVRGNRSQQVNAKGAHWFVDVEATYTTGGRAWQMQPDPVPRWTLGTAVWHLMWTLNYGELQIKNFTGGLGQLESMFDGQKFEHHRLPTGKHLDELLDLVLEPYGYGWYLDLTKGSKPEIQIFRRGDTGADIARVKFQKAGEMLDLSKTNCEEFALAYDVAKNLTNEVTVRADHEYVEVTLELEKGWRKADDALNVSSNLNIHSAGYLANPRYQEVWRRWVVNEAGDYCGLRPELTKPTDLSGYFLTQTKSYVARKRFYPCLSQNADLTPAGEQHGVRVEIDFGQGYIPLSRLGEHQPIQVLEHELGIRFAGIEPPRELIAAGDDAKVRITATIRSERRLSYTATPGQGNIQFNASVNPQRVPVVIEQPERYHLRRLHSSSTFFSEVAAGTRQATVVDDRPALKSLAERLLAKWNQAQCSGPVVLPGFDEDNYDLGWQVQQIAGRALKLQVHHSEGRSPQIVQIEYDFRGQRTVLVLDTLREGELLD